MMQDCQARGKKYEEEGFMRIFVVEDEPIIQRELKVLLENASYQVVLPDSYERLPEQIQAGRPDF